MQQVKGHGTLRKGRDMEGLLHHRITERFGFEGTFKITLFQVITFY